MAKKSVTAPAPSCSFSMACFAKSRVKVAAPRVYGKEEYFSAVSVDKRCGKVTVFNPGMALSYGLSSALLASYLLIGNKVLQSVFMYSPAISFALNLFTHSGRDFM